MSQSTSPAELPISGSVEAGEVELRIESETHKYFHIQDKRLRLTRPLDRDATLREVSDVNLMSHLDTKSNSNLTQPKPKQNSSTTQPISSIYLQISCTDRRSSAPATTKGKKVIIPVLVKVLDLNDNAPKFSQPVYSVQVDELTPVNSILLDSIYALDLDSANNAQVEYSLVSSPARRPAQVVAASSSSSSSRLVQRAQPTSSPSYAAQASQQQTTTTPSPQTTTVAASSTTASTTSTSQTTPAADTNSSSSNSTGASTTVANRDTFNLNSEPILNGPMEMDGEEEESDEAMLASLNANSNSSHLDIPNEPPEEPADVASFEAGDGSEEEHQTSRAKRKRRRRKRRHSSHELQQTTTLTPITTTFSAPKQRRENPDSPPWTNLMAAGGEELQAAPNHYQEHEQEDFFSLEFSPNQTNNRPILRLKRPLDYETRRLHTLTIVATDLAANKHERLSSQATILIKVLDGDDQAPAFLLDQAGCATNSLPQTTTPTSLRSTGEADAGDAPRGFKVSDDNFDFGDALGLDDSPIEDAAGRARRLTAQTATSSTAQQVSKGNKQQHFEYHQCLSGSSSGSQVAEYFSTIMSGDSEYLLRVSPQSIRARDRDELNAPIRYSFVNSTLANHQQYFQINPLDASIKQIGPIDKSRLASDQIVMWIQAQEVSPNRLATLAKLTIEVLASDKNPPVLVPNSYSGLVDENSPIGTRVRVATPGQQVSSNLTSFMRINVQDPDDLVRRQTSAGSTTTTPTVMPTTIANSNYEFETTSDAFKVDRNGFVYVNKWPLDRDLPNQGSVHMFQVTAQQVGLVSSRSVSSPISLNVSLVDVNDNAPVLVNSTLGPYQMASNARGGAQLVGQIRAYDPDLAGDNSRVHFAIKHVSNNGRARFRIDEDTGQLESLGRFQAGEQFSLTVQVSDELGRANQAIVEVQIVQGANSGPPQFIIDGSERDNSRGYSIEVNEAAQVGSVVLQVHAQDPDNDSITYNLVGLDGKSSVQSAASGTANQHDFSINSKTGFISVANKLDREEISAYNLLVQARDSAGLATSRPVYVTITDSNDQNPSFGQSSYVFAVNEGSQPVGQIIGQVSASDADWAENGRLSYSLISQNEQHRQLFEIDSSSGEIRLLKPLDYEMDKTFTLLVTATDHGETPRSNSTSVQVQVVDVQDEAPYFERYFYEVRLDENQPNERVAVVQARDPDSRAQISYLLMSGDSSLFAVDPQTGLVSTLRGLDYEESRFHSLLVGTNESNHLDLAETSRHLNELVASSAKTSEPYRSPLVRIDVHVNDLNDNAPQFESPQPLPVRCQASAQLGAVLTRTLAFDRDGSSPNNQIRYELVTATSRAEAGTQEQEPEVAASTTSSRCAQLFMVDSTSGQVSVRSDLRRDSQLSECVLVVRAHDLAQKPEQRLSSTISLTIFIDHLVEISPSSMVGFADTSFTVEVNENCPTNTLVKTLTVINKPKLAVFPMSCEILSGNELAKFYVSDNEQRDCELRTRDHLLDYEHRSRYNLVIRLNTVGAGAGSSNAAGGSSSAPNSTPRMLAQVQVNILDKNDNRPTFHPPARYSQLTSGRFLAAISADSPPETQVIQVRASDADTSQSNGMISYELLNELELEGRFKVEPVDGIVRTAKPVEDIPGTRLPIRLKVMARDNPEQASETMDSIAEVVLNLIDDRHRIALVLKDTPASRVLDCKEELLAVLQERTGLISGLERVESLKFQKNSSLIEPDVSGSDVWFYLIEPGTLRIVASDDPRIRATLFDTRAQNSLLDVLEQTLGEL